MCMLIGSIYMWSFRPVAFNKSHVTNSTNQNEKGTAISTPPIRWERNWLQKQFSRDNVTRRANNDGFRRKHWNELNIWKRLDLFLFGWIYVPKLGSGVKQRAAGAHRSLFKAVRLQLIGSGKMWKWKAPFVIIRPVLVWCWREMFRRTKWISRHSCKISIQGTYPLF